MSRRRSTSSWLAVVLLLLVTSRAHAQAGDIGSPPGRLVDIGGRRLHLKCTGQGSPTVVFENGGGAFSIDWALVQPSIAKTTRACSYDRARHVWSDPSPDAETPESVARDFTCGSSSAGIAARVKRCPLAMSTCPRGQVPRATVVEAVEGQRAAFAELQESRRTRPDEFANRPIVALTRGINTPDGLRAAHATLAAASKQGRHAVVPGAGHEIQLFQPASVIEAIEEVVSNVRSSRT